MEITYYAKEGENLEIIRRLFLEYTDWLEKEALVFVREFQAFEEELANLPGDYGSPKGRLLLARYRDQAVGCIGLRDLGEDICEMKRLYVKKQFRGKGMGRALAEAVITEARKIGYTHMRLDTVPSMETARALYVSLGFKKIDPYRYNPIDGAVFMELEL